MTKTIHDVPSSLQCIILIHLPIKCSICTSVVNKTWWKTAQRPEAKVKHQDYLIKAQEDTIDKWLIKITPYHPRSLAIKLSKSELYVVDNKTNKEKDSVMYQLTRPLCESLKSLTVELLDMIQTPPYWFFNLTSLTFTQLPGRHYLKEQGHQLGHFIALKTFNGVLSLVGDWKYLPSSLTSLDLKFHSTHSLSSDQFIQLLKHLPSLTYINCFVDETSVDMYYTLLTHPSLTSIGPLVFWFVTHDDLEGAVELLSSSSIMDKQPLNVLQRMTTFESECSTMLVTSMLSILAPQLTKLSVKFGIYYTYQHAVDDLVSLIKGMKKLTSLKVKLGCLRENLTMIPLNHFLPPLSHVLTSLTLHLNSQPNATALLFSTFPSLPHLNELCYIMLTQSKQYSLRWYSKWKSHPQLKYISFQGNVLTEHWASVFKDIHHACRDQKDELEDDEMVINDEELSTHEKQKKPALNVANDDELKTDEKSTDSTPPSRLYLKLPGKQDESGNFYTLYRYGIVRVQALGKPFSAPLNKQTIPTVDDILIKQGIYYHTPEVEQLCF